MKKYEKIYHDILSKIKNGTLKPGDRLPTEFALMEEYKVSRITSTKAMTQLSEKGYIYRRQRHGSFVTAMPVRDYNISLILPYNEYLNAEIVAGAQAAAAENNCIIRFCNSENNPLAEHSLIQKCLVENTDGIMLYPCSEFENIEILHEVRKKKTPLLFLDRDVLGINAPLIVSDNFQGTYALTAALLKKGYTNLGYYGLYSAMNITERERFSGFTACLLNKQKSVNQKNIYSIPYPVSKDFRYARELSKELFIVAEQILADFLSRSTKQKSAIICTNDYLAYSIFMASKRYPEISPDSFTFTGFDNISYAKTCGFSTIEQDFYKLGHTALLGMSNLINNNQVPPVTKIPVRLILR